MKALSKFFSRSPAERRLTIAALFTVFTVRCALWLLPSRVILKKVRQLAPESSERVTAALRVSTIVWAVEAVSARVPGASCLTQAVSAQLLLRRYGHASQLCVGVARGDQGELRAHAWLERQGQVIIGGTTDAYTPLSEFPDSRLVSRLGSR